MLLVTGAPEQPVDRRIAQRLDAIKILFIFTKLSSYNIVVILLTTLKKYALLLL